MLNQNKEIIELIQNIKCSPGKVLGLMYHDYKTINQKFLLSVMLLYNFEINTYKVDVTAERENEYHISLDGVYAGIIFAEFIDEPPFMIWRTNDLIQEDLVQKIGEAIEDD